MTWKEQLLVDLFKNRMVLASKVVLSDISQVLLLMNHSYLQKHPSSVPDPPIFPRILLPPTRKSFPVTQGWFSANFSSLFKHSGTVALGFCDDFIAILSAQLAVNSSREWGLLRVLESVCYEQYTMMTLSNTRISIYSHSHMYKEDRGLSTYCIFLTETQADVGLWYTEGHNILFSLLGLVL